jgi:hypothetical protein
VKTCLEAIPTSSVLVSRACAVHGISVCSLETILYNHTAQVARGFRDASFWKSQSKPEERAYGWYLDKVRETVALVRLETGAPKVRLLLLLHALQLNMRSVKRSTQTALAQLFIKHIRSV